MHILSSDSGTGVDTSDHLKFKEKETLDIGVKINNIDKHNNSSTVFKDKTKDFLTWGL